MDARSFLVGFASCLLLFGFNTLPQFGDVVSEVKSASTGGHRNLEEETDTKKLNVGTKEPAKLIKREHRKENGEGHEEMDEASEEEESIHEDETEEENEEENGVEEEEEHFTSADVQVAYVVLGAVIIDVFLFELVNWDDDDIRLYTWSILSMTISIFVAVLSFGGVNQYVELLSEGMDPWIRVALAYCQSLAYLLLMLFWISFESGMICEPKTVDLNEETWTIADANRAEHGRPLTPEEASTIVLSTEANTKRGTFTDEFGNQISVMKRQLILEQRLRRMKCYAGLLAHMAGFAAINAGGHLQHMHIFSASPVLCCVPILLTGVLCQVVFSLSKAFRKFHLRAAIAAGRAGRRAKLCEEFVEDAENDVLSLSTSFLMVQALRFALTGVLPNLEGVEVPEVKASWAAVAGLLGCAVFFAGMSSILAILLIRDSEKQAQVQKAQARTAECHPREPSRGRIGRTSLTSHEGGELTEEIISFTFMERLGPTGMSAMAMSFAWCFLFATRWICIIMPFVNLETMMGVIKLALILTIIVGFSVFVFDKVDDFLRSRGDSEAGSLAVSTIINALALLVGFTWEKCFDNGVEAITEELGGAHARGMKFMLAIVVCVFVVRPWRRYILTKVMYLEILKKARTQQIKQKASHYVKLESQPSG